MEDRSSNVDFEDCTQCAVELGSGICANCERDSTFCVECGRSGNCRFCEGTGRLPIEVPQSVRDEVEAAGPLVVPEGME